MLPSVTPNVRQCGGHGGVGASGKGGQGACHTATAGPQTRSIPRNPGQFECRQGEVTARSTDQYKARRRVVAGAFGPSSTQDIIIGGAVVSSVAAALFLGFQREKEVCTSCNGSGGVVCFACEGTGIMDSVSPEVERQTRQANLGRSASKLECRACKGVGRLLCKKCSGSGYS